MPGTAYYAITVAAFTAYYPQFVRAFTDGLRNLEHIMRRVALLVLISGLAAWLATLCTLDVFTSVVGNKFEVAITLAPVLVISKAIGGLVLVARAGLLAQGREKFVYTTYVCIGCFGLAMNYILIPQYGLLGAAGVELGLELFHGILLFIALKKTC